MSSPTTSSLPRPTTPKLTLLTLPLEIRHLIYSLTLPTPITICKSKTKPCPHLCPSRHARSNRQTILERSNDRKLTTELNLLFVCLQMAAEAISVYQGMEFTFRSVECVAHLCARLRAPRSHALKRILIESDERLSFDEREELLPALEEARGRDALPRRQRLLLQRIRDAFLDADAVVEARGVDGRSLDSSYGRRRFTRAGVGVGRTQAWRFGAHARGGR